jgi:hypothetical protein
MPVTNPVKVPITIWIIIIVIVLLIIGVVIWIVIISKNLKTCETSEHPGLCPSFYCPVASTKCGHAPYRFNDTSVCQEYTLRKVSAKIKD